MVNIGVQLFEFFVGIEVEDSGVIDAFSNTVGSLLSQGAGLPLHSVDRLTEGEQKQSSSNILVVGVLKTDKVGGRTNKGLLDVFGADTVIQRQSSGHLNL